MPLTVLVFNGDMAQYTPEDGTGVLKHVKVANIGMS
jgi:hypothetical protein